MARHTGWLFAVLLAWASPAAAVAMDCTQGTQQKPAANAKNPAPSQQSERRKWWLHDRAELGITDQQSLQIEQIFNTSVPALRTMREELDKLEAALSATITAHVADVTTVAREVERVEKTRAEYSKARTVMLYKMTLVLTPEQRTKLKALRERREAERRKDDRRH
jgi:Spy/CpxP family protein refolding chaperone